MSYNSLILLPADSRASIDDVERIARESYADDEREVFLEVGDTDLTLTIEEWEMIISLNNSPHVLAESKEMAEEFAAARPDKDEIAACDRRFEISTDADADMEYFNDYALMTERLGNLEGAKIWEGAQQEFM